MSELKEEQSLVNDNKNHIVIYTDFKDWLMNETTKYVEGESKKKKTYSRKA